MTIKIENKPVEGRVSAERLEIKAAISSLKIGQSFVFSNEHLDAARGFAGRANGRFSTRVEGARVRIGRLA